MALTGFDFKCAHDWIFSKKINKVNLENKEQIHVLKMKNGARYLGKIVSMTSKHIVFKLDDVMGNELKLRRKDIDIVGSFTPTMEESGVLRKPFDRLQKTFRFLLYATNVRNGN